MRDPRRIPVYCDRFIEAWKKRCDLSFLEFLTFVCQEYNCDIFFPEDENFISFIERVSEASSVDDTHIKTKWPYDRVRAAIIERWSEVPDQRFGQMISNYIYDIVDMIKG